MASKTQPPSGFFPPEEAKKKINLGADDVANQGRLLLNDFIHASLMREGIENAPGFEQLQEPGTPVGPPLDHRREIARALRCIGDELDHDQKLQQLISKVPAESPRTTILNVARQIFADGIFNWGRVTALFYFAYEVCRKALDRIPLMRAVINLIVDFIRDHVASWIIGRGGWEAVREYFGSTWKQVALVTGAGVAVVTAMYLSKAWH